VGDTGGLRLRTWVSASGGHIGRNREWSDAQFFESVITPWFARRLK
jgi:hypothetical protein